MNRDEAKKEEFMLLTKAYNFTNHSLTLLTNKKTFPEKYKRITDKMQDYAISVPIYISEGNYHKDTRYANGKRAIMVIDRFLKLLELLYNIDSNFGKQKMNVTIQNNKKIVYLHKRNFEISNSRHADERNTNWSYAMLSRDTKNAS